MIDRHLAAPLRRAAKAYPVVTVTGPRQSGKTTLCRATFPSHDYVSLEAPDDRAFALEDPRGFLNRFHGGVVLDEVQRVPSLLSYIQVIVDQDARPGRFVLTGSQNLLLLERISQSLAGRSAVLHLLPFSRAELANRKSFPIRQIGRRLPRPRGRPSHPGNLFEMLVKGFYPRIHDKKLDAQDWLRNYYQTYVERDVRDLIQVGDLETFGRFVRLCAGRCGQLLNLSSLGADSGISHTTARRWISVLETSFVVYLLRPYHRSFNKRLVKSPKLYFCDSGLLCYLLRIRAAEDLVRHSSRGAVFESFVLSELLKAYLHSGKEADVYFWRDAAGHEVDFLLDHGQEAVPVEAKSGETIAPDFFRSIEFWRYLTGDEKAPAALVYGGESSFVRQLTAVYSWRDWL